MKPQELAYTMINGRLGLVGNNYAFTNEDFFNLNVGEKIVQIGCGKENGTTRTDKFSNHLTYVGSIYCNFFCVEKMFAFEIPITSEKKHFLLYGTTGIEIFTEALYSRKNRITKKTTSYMRFYKPIFKN